MDDMFRCGKDTSKPSDSELIRGSTDPPGELNGVRVSYLWNFRSTNVGRRNQKRKSRARGGHEEGTMDVRTNVRLASFINSSKLKDYSTTGRQASGLCMIPKREAHGLNLNSG
jgi:hypothetical protein